MSEYESITIKEFVPHERDDIEPYLNKLSVINVCWLKQPLFGVVSEIGPSFITLKRKDGRLSKIRRSSILGIEEWEPRPRTDEAVV